MMKISFYFSSAEGEVIHQYQHQLKLQEDGRIFIIFPLTICHVIDAMSPFYNLSAKDFVEKRYFSCFDTSFSN